MLACHVCEGDRNPRLCAYRCASGCEMICDISCAKSEIIPILQGKQGDVKLRSVISNIPGKVARQGSVIEAAPDVLYAKEKPRHFFVDMLHRIYALQYTEQDGFGGGSVEEVDASDVVDAKSKIEKRSHSIFVLCCVVHSMYMTKAVDVTEGTISQWLSCLKLLQRAGFRVGFLIDQTKCIARASFLVTRRRLIDMRCYRIQSEIEHLAQKIARLAEELETAKGDLEKTLVRKDHIRSYAVAATKTMRKPYEEAIRVKWKPAVDGL